MSNVSTEKQKLLKREFIDYLKAKHIPPENFLNRLQRQVKYYLSAHDININNLMEVDNLDELRNWLTLIESEKDNFVYVNKRKDDVKVVGLKYYIDFLEQRSSFVDESAEDQLYTEGTEQDKTSIAYERNRIARQKCIDKYGYKCYVCDMNFEDVYGKIGKDFIEVHHRIPIAKRGGEYKLDPIKDLVPLCSNCHSMVHRTIDTMDVDVLKDLLKKT